ncbi:MAG: hypothetical protein A4E56_01734 [Pelotomaculum sp. PtaU1.Bin065]|nr:MAG: hypothetical protein A4E56_01734 [Pelotomaculum sp. PtaU1.Bin065]
MQRGLNKWMAGRYGADQLSLALMLLSLALMIVASLTGVWVLSIASFAPMTWCFFRLFSRKIYQRSAENQRFLGGLLALRSKIRGGFRRLRDLRTHRYFRCTHCGTVLRVPRGKGKIRITCSKCGEKFGART